VTPASLEATISAVAARCLRTAAGAVDPETPFALLGIDSLASIELAAALQETLGCELPPTILAECEDVRSLARRIAADRCQPSDDDPFDRMLADSVLPDDVRPCGGTAGQPTPDLGEAHNILVTGATGFLGAYLVRELLSRSNATLHCLVRDAAAAIARQRLRTHLLDRGVDAQVFDRRVRTVTGDLARPQLGCSSASLDRLAGEIDAICHAGASVNWVFPYSSLRDVNVGGTVSLLLLACRGRCIPFHFISSLSTVYSTRGPREADEAFDPLPHLRGLHLGYAQTKAVAEALVREAGHRGLPVKTYRPSLISGDAVTGTFNRDDFLSLLVSGCIRMGCAPDLDWKLDCLPVDVVAREIVGASAAPRGVVHLVHPRPRHWRECVLWLRLYGYPIRLVSYHTWLRQLELDTDPRHPLRPLRAFFLDRPEDGLTLPQLYEESRRTRATAIEPPCECPPLDAALLDRYFDAFVTAAHVPPPPRDATAVTRPAAAIAFDRAFFAAALNECAPGTDVVAIEPLGTGSDHSIVSELTSWRSGSTSGLYRFALTLNHRERREVRRVVVKVKPEDREVIAVGEALAHLCDPGIGAAYRRWSSRLGVLKSHLREPAIYAQRDRRFTRHAPRVLGNLCDARSARHVIVLEDISDASLLDSAGSGAWTQDDIACAIRGVAALHAIWHGREADLRQLPWTGYTASADRVAEMSDLWEALANHAGPAFSSWADPSIGAIQRRVAGSCGRWWRWMEASPQTLVHHDFNPRNICLRGPQSNRRLCAYDWELATIGAPQRDLAELLCFVMGPDATREEAMRWLDLHRSSLERETGSTIAPDVWLKGFRAGLYDLMLNRLPMYALIHRVRRQSFLPRVVRTWRRLYQHFPLDAPAA
jgi:thioester reductase-like protein